MLVQNHNNEYASLPDGNCVFIFNDKLDSVEEFYKQLIL